MLGKPNVGKSSLVNCILHENKMVVSDVSGTTRDAIDSTFVYDNEQYVIIDTAGLRQRGKLDELEKFSLLRSQLALKRSQFAILIIDASKPLTDQDKHVAQLIYEANMPCIIVANKIDLIPGFNNAIRKDLENRFKQEFKFLPYAQYLFTSCLDDDVNVKLLLKMMNEVNNQLQLKIDQRYLDQLINKVQVVNEPPLFKGGRVELLGIEQVNGRMPTFVINVNDVKYLHFSYMRYVENQIKTTFNFNLVPILVYYKDSKKKEVAGHE
ncbi:50S ribosome-binding GTPase [bacterium]|nr:50S ribosome-binding GTPase [bacterium]